MYIVLNDDKYILAMSETPLGDSIEMELPEDFNYDYQGCYRFEDGEFIFDEEKAADYSLNDLRAIRAPILQAFDIYKTNVIYGIEQETNKEEILDWYQDVLDLKPEALENVPPQVQKYM